MNKMTDNDLIELYYGEHDDPMLARTVANSPELSARFEALCAELKKIDTFVPPERGEDFGARIWRQITPKLETGLSPAPTGLAAWLLTPRRSRG